MYCHRFVVNLKKRDDRVHLRPIGDVHIGNVGFDKEKFERSIDYIAKTEGCYTIGMGDYIDNIQAWAQGSVDKRFNPLTIERNRMTTEEQIWYFVSQWKKVASKSLGLMSGNHEWKTLTYQRMVDDMCNPTEMEETRVTEHGVEQVSYGPKLNPATGKPDVLYHNKYLGRMCYVNVACKYNGNLLRNYLIFAHHGGYGGNRKGGAINRLEDLSGAFDFDLALMGHTHDTIIATNTFVTYDLKHNVPLERKQILANTGTFLHGYNKNTDNYAEITPKRVKRVGTVTITLVPETGDLYGHD